MIRGYPNARPPDSYHGAMAETFMSYPRHVALACADPFGGVVLQSPEFPPSQSKAIQWCEKRCRPLREEAARDDRIAEQLEAREAWQNEPRPPAMIEKTKAWLDRTDPDAQKLVAPKRHEAERRRQAALKTIEDAGRQVFERECARDGIDPARGVSPSLLRALEQDHVPDARESEWPPGQRTEA
jgi:hypothetical protein